MTPSRDAFCLVRKESGDNTLWDNHSCDKGEDDSLTELWERADMHRLQQIYNTDIFISHFL